MKHNKEDFEFLDNCPWCESKNYNKWGEEAKGFTTAKCSDCGLIFVKNRLNKGGLSKYYENYLSDVHQANNILNELRSKMYDLEFQIIDRFSKKTNVLDVGCNGGYFLDLFKEYGYDCYGVEFGEAAAKEAAKKHRVWHRDFSELNIDKKFDLIIFRGVIEHIPYPKSYLDKAVSLLNKGGLIYITSTPNSNAFCCELFKENWNQHEPEAHLMHFNTKHFDEFFEKKNLRKVYQYFFYEETPYANIEKDILKVAEAIRLKRENKKINFKSPAFWGNMMSLVFKKQ